MSTVVMFPGRSKKPTTHSIPLTLEFDEDNKLSNIVIHKPHVSSEELRILMEACFRASWWIDGEYSKRASDGSPDRLLMLMKLHQNSRVHVMVNDGDDAFEGPVRQEWLRKRLMEALELALPSSSVAEPASGMISPSHSANLDQLSFW